MQNADGNSEGGSGSFWSKAWEVAKPHAGQVAGKAGQFALDRYGQPIKDKFNHLIPVKGQDVSAADLAQVDPVQMEQAEQSQAAQGAAEVDPSTYEGEQSGVGDAQGGAVQGGGSASSGSGGVENGNGVDETAAQGNSQDVGPVGQQNGSPSSNAGQNGQTGDGGQQNGGASQQSGSIMNNDSKDSLDGASGQGNSGNVAGNQIGNRGNQGKQNAPAQSGNAQGDASQQDTTQNTGFESGNVPNAAQSSQPGSHVRSKRAASSNLASAGLNWNGTSASGGGALPSGSAPSVPLGTGTTSGTDGNDGLACPVHGDVSPDEMQGDDDPDSALPVGSPAECKQKRDVLRLRTVSNCSPTVVSSGSTFTSTIVCNEDVVSARDEICDPAASTAASGASFATGGAVGSAGGSALFPNGTATSDPIVKTANAGAATNLGARNPKPRDGGPFIVDKSFAGSGSNSSIRSQMAGTAYSGIGKGSALPMISIDGPACSPRLSSNIIVSYSSNSTGTSSSTAGVTGGITSSVPPLREGPIGPISARGGPESESQSRIRLMVSHGTSPASSPHVSITKTEIHSLHLGSAVLGQRWAHEFAGVPATTQASGAEDTGSAGSGQVATDSEDADGDNQGIEEEALEGEDFDME